MHTTIFAATPEALRDEVVRYLEHRTDLADALGRSETAHFIRDAAEYWRDMKIEPPKEPGND